MKIDIEAYGLELDTRLNHFARYCAAFELGAHSDRIESVQIQLTHLQEPRHVENRYCLVRVDLTDGRSIQTRNSGPDLHVAIYRALENAGRMSARRRLHEQPRVDRPPAPRQHAPSPDEPNWAA